MNKRMKRWLERNWLNICIAIILAIILMPIVFKEQEKQARRNKEAVEAILQEEKTYIPPKGTLVTLKPIVAEEVATGLLKNVAKSSKTAENGNAKILPTSQPIVVKDVKTGFLKKVIQSPKIVVLIDEIANAKAVETSQMVSEEVAIGFLKGVTPFPKEVEDNKEEKKKKKKSSQKSKAKKGFPKLKSEEYILAQIINQETNNKEDRVYVGSVVINRCRTTYKDFRGINTIKEVLYQNYGKRNQQYASETVRAVKAGVKPSKAALKVAHGLISGEIECLEEKILFQTTTKQAWMKGQIGDANLKNASEYYGYPLNFEAGCK